MPPKAKFSKEEIIEAAFAIVRSDGVDALTARALGARLESSARPIFTVFQSMEEVEREVIGAAKRLYAEYVERGLSDAVPFKGVGTQYISFAINEPMLFRLLFMTEQKQAPGVGSVLLYIEDSYEKILSSVETSYALDREAAEGLYRHLWIYTHGIATLCATGMCTFTAEEIGAMMTEVFVSLLKAIPGGHGRKTDGIHVHP